MSGPNEYHNKASMTLGLEHGRPPSPLTKCSLVAVSSVMKLDDVRNHLSWATDEDVAR